MVVYKVTLYVVYKVKSGAHRHALLCHMAMHVALLHDTNACHTVA